MEAYVFEIERKLTGQELAPSGKVRITTTDSLLFGPISRIVANLHHTLPQIRLEVVSSNNLLRISRREADIAIRPSSENPEQLVGQSVGRIEQAIYGSRRCFGDMAGAKEYADLPWIAADESMSYSLLDNWMEAEDLNPSVAQRYNTLLGMFAAVRNGAGLCALPCYLGDSDETLVRMGTCVPDLATDLWVLTHKDLQQTVRIKAVVEHLTKELKTVFS
ncbi:LysR family transcriptional regulator [Thalassococcus sp. S3]|nr:LysR family transcriptional regulator [Thalassococcus sp. S3]